MQPAQPDPITTHLVSIEPHLSAKPIARSGGARYQQSMNKRTPAYKPRRHPADGTRDRHPIHRRPSPSPDPDRTVPDPVIYGNHAVEAALRNSRRSINQAMLTENAQRRFGSLLTARAVPVETVTARDLDRRLGPDTVHQGALLEVEPLPDLPLSELVAQALARPILVLDQVTDPHNVGAILRSAAVFGAAGLVMTRRHSPPTFGALAKSASGALELVPIAYVQNLARALAELQQSGCRIVGLDGEAADLLEDTPLQGPTALVLGAEGKGLRQSTKDGCDELASIATDGPLRSLNVSNAAAVALHLAAMQRRHAKR